MTRRQRRRRRARNQRILAIVTGAAAIGFLVALAVAAAG
jgi:hypothetical protein